MQGGPCLKDPKIYGSLKLKRETVHQRINFRKPNSMLDSETKSEHYRIITLNLLFLVTSSNKTTAQKDFHYNC